MLPNGSNVDIMHKMKTTGKLTVNSGQEDMTGKFNSKPRSTRYVADLCIGSLLFLCYKLTIIFTIDYQIKSKSFI
jgi:hypothetical protein